MDTKMVKGTDMKTDTDMEMDKDYDIDTDMDIRIFRKYLLLWNCVCHDQR